MLRDTLKDRMQCADANGIVMRNDFVMFTAKLRGHADVRAFLAGDRIAELSKRLDQGVSRHVAGQFHLRAL